MAIGESFVCECRRRPLDEFGEVQQECRLDLVFQGCSRGASQIGCGNGPCMPTARRDTRNATARAECRGPEPRPGWLTCSMSVSRKRFS